ncbi:hypothetical protein D3C84_296030 [compost metagenome]
MATSPNTTPWPVPCCKAWAIGKFSNTSKVSNSDSPPCPAQRWMFASGVCSNSRKLRFCACTAASQAATVCSGWEPAITGKVLMNRPTCCSIPGNSAGRPATVVPNATHGLAV